MKTLVLLVLLGIGTGTCVFGQALPTPENPGRDWVVKEVHPRQQSGMPVQRMNNSSDNMPGLAVKSFSYDSKTGEAKLYYDSETKIGYDFEKGLMTDISSGKVFQFYKKGTAPKPLPEGYRN